MKNIFTILCSLLVTVGFSQVRPDQFLEQTNPTNANFEFYSQKSGAPRRATFTNVKKGMVPFVTDTLAGVPTATGNVTNLGEFVWDQYGALWYIDGEGDAISFTGGGPIYVLPDTTAQTLVYAPAHGLTDTIALYGYVPVKADFTRANSSAVDSAFIAYAIDAPHPDSLLLVFSGILTYGAWHGKEISVQYYLQDDGSEDTTAGTVSIPTAIASDSLTLFLREVGTDIAGRLRRIAMPSPLITAFGGNPASPTDAVVQAAIVGTYLPAGLAQPGTVFTLSYATQSYNPIYQQTAPNTNPLTPSYAWLWDGAYATRIVNIPTSVNLQDTSYGVLGTLVLLPIDSLMAASVPTDTEVALWLDTNYTANNLRLANGSLLYFIGDSTRQNPQYIWHVIDDISYDSGDTDWEKILKRIKFPVVAADGNGIFDAANDGDTTAVASVVLGQDFTVDVDGNDWLFGGIVEDDTTSRIMTLRGDGSLAYRWLDSLLNGYTTGTGTSGTIPIWNGTSSLGNSSLTEASGVLSSSLTGALKLPSGTDAQDPVWSAGMLRYNTTTNGLQGYNGSTELYIPWADASSSSSGRIPFWDGTKLTSSNGLRNDGIGSQQFVFSFASQWAKIQHTHNLGSDAGLQFYSSKHIDISSSGTGTNYPSYSINGILQQTAGPFFVKIEGVAFANRGILINGKSDPSQNNFSERGEIRHDGTSFNTNPAATPLYIFGMSKSNHASSNYAGDVVICGGDASGANPEDGDVILAWNGTTGLGNVGVKTLSPTSDFDLNGKGRIRNLPDSLYTYELRADSAGRLVRQVGSFVGTISTSTDGSGDITVAHGMGTTPTSVQVTVTGTTPYVVTVHSIDATNFTVRFFDMTGAAVVSTAVTATWHAKT